ncbi:eCIS core domain-containing protein [Nitrosovibrio tenuis]|uniref:eCIS core domain-containing protein n=1 Tax=Nitrosovibrio tenuis TaxID=1233 RepID=UPI001C43534D|nr:DUF4157 domain-containing protein [Nitrosovibrio tenuis]
MTQLIRAKRITPQGKIIGNQRKLTVGASNDQYEQEADHVARQVMSISDPVVDNSMQRNISTEEDKDKVLQTKPLADSITPFVQRELENRGKTEDKEEDKNEEIAVQANSIGGDTDLQRQPEMEDEEEKPIQAKSIQTKAEPADSFDAGEAVESRLNGSKGGGSPLPDSVRGYMEPRFGMDFSHVRVHTGSEAAQLNQDVGAKAFTHGSHIYYGTGNNPANLELTAHELTHVVQQTGDERRKDGVDNRRLQYHKIEHQVGVQRVHLDAAGRKVFDCPEFLGDKKLEGCLNDKDRLRPSEHGPTVAKVQKALLRDGADLGKRGVDGDYGPATARAVMAFKKKYKLGFEKFPDVGPGTMAKLDELCLPSPQPLCPPCPEDPRTPGCPACPPLRRLARLAPRAPVLPDAHPARNHPGL